MIAGPIHPFPPFEELVSEGSDPSKVLAIYSTFDPVPELFCEHCTELAEHSLASKECGDINLCPKCLADALDVLKALKNFGRKSRS